MFWVAMAFKIQQKFLIMEEMSINRGEKFCKVEQKLQQLAQSKLQNLNTATMKKVEDRLLALEKGLCEEVASNEKTVREYRLLLRKYEEHFEQTAARCHQNTVIRTCKIAQLKQLMGEYFTCEDSDSKRLYKQAPLAFEEKTQRIARELSDQITDRRLETIDLEGRAQEALLAFRGSMHGQLTDLDKEADIRFEELRASCEALRGGIGKETEVRRKAEGGLMEQLRDTVGQIKQLLATERSQREKNWDKLRSLLSNTKETIASV